MYILQQQCELIASVPADRIRVAYTGQQASCHRLKKFVAGCMSQGIVDVFEAIQIHEQYGGLSPVSPRKKDCLANQVQKEPSIGQTG